MVASKLTPKAQLRASSILEVIISMVVIVIVFSIAMGIFANVQRLSLSAQKIHAEGTLKELLLKSENMPEISIEIISVDGFRIDKEIRVFNGSNALYQISLKAYDENQVKLAELNQILYHAQ